MTITTPDNLSFDQWSNMIRGSARKAIQTDNLPILPFLTKKYELDKSKLPFEEVLLHIPNLSSIQKFDYQDSAVHMKPSINGFNGIIYNYYYGTDTENFDISPLFSRSEDLTGRWRAWFVNKFKSEPEIEKVTTRSLPSVLHEKKIMLVAPIKDAKKLILTLPTWKSVDGRQGTPTVIIETNTSDSTKSFGKFIMETGALGLNALFAILSSSDVSPTLTLLDKHNSTPQRHSIFAGVPGSKISLKEVNEEVGK